MTALIMSYRHRVPCLNAIHMAVGSCYLQLKAYMPSVSLECGRAAAKADYFVVCSGRRPTHARN